jgi:transcriptional regulator with XRE-family HTH domain
MPDDNKIQVALRLKVARKALEITQKKFGELLDLPQNTVKNLETGVTKITVELAISIEKIHGINLRWLLTGEGEMFLKGVDDEAEPDPASAEVSRLMEGLDEEGRQSVLQSARDADRIVRLEKKLTG